MREDIVVGAAMADYQLEDPGGVLRKLSELQGGKGLDIEEHTDPHNPMIPHTFVLEPGAWSLDSGSSAPTTGYWYWGRPTMDE